MDQQRLQQIQDELVRKSDELWNHSTTMTRTIEGYKGDPKYNDLLNQSKDLTRIIEGFREEFNHFKELFDRVS